MRIISISKLRAFWGRHADAESALRSWHTLAQEAEWENPTEVRNTFRSADPVGEEFVVFNICHNEYRLVVRVDYRRGIIYIWDVLTHREYDRLDLQAIDKKIEDEKKKKQ